MLQRLPLSFVTAAVAAGQVAGTVPSPQENIVQPRT